MRKYITLMQMTANQLKEKRRGLNLTQKEFAEFIGVSKSTVERWETATQPITGPVVQLLQVLTPEYLASITVPPRELPFRLWYMYKDEVCTLIDVHEGKQIVKIYNYTKNVQFRAFGSNENPSFQDYEEFLKSRCFSENRDKMKLILRDLNLPFYDPFMIIEKTQGRMAEDDFWIKVEK